MGGDGVIVATMKSAYELAMERLGGDPVTKLSEEQREELAVIENKFKAKLAEREVFLQGLITKAMESANYQEIGELESQLVREKAQLEREMEESKEKVRKAG